MPYRRRAARVSKKKVAPRRRAPHRRPVLRRRRTLYNVAPSGMPRVRTARLRYVQRFTINPQIEGAVDFVQFRANGAFNPAADTSAGGTHTDAHQPMGWDQWAVLFNNYVVKGSKITVTRYGVTNEATPAEDQIGSGRFGVYLSDSSTVAYTKGTSFKEARKGSMRYVMNQQRTAQSCQGFYSPRRMYGIKDIKDNQDRLGATVTATPVEEAFFTCWLDWDSGPVAPLGTIWHFEATIEYFVQFDEPVDIAQSATAAFAALSVIAEKT